MHFDLDEDERALQEGVRELCRGRLGLDRLRQAEGGGLDRSVWAEVAEAGVFGLRYAAELGGLGLGTTHAAVVFEELGRALVPGPLVATHLAAGLVDGAPDGSTVVGLVEEGDGPVLIEHAGDLDALLLLGPGRVGLLRAGAFDGSPVTRPLDPLTPLRRVDDLPEGDELGTRWLAARLRREGAVLTAALQLGNALATADLAVAYAKERQQFGRPIGSFQAVKHLCADMRVRAEVARAAVYAAAVVLDDPGSGDADSAVATAKLLADEAAHDNAKTCVHVHGGMGFTWEVPAHLYLKRARVAATTFGSADDHEHALAAAL